MQLLTNKSDISNKDLFQTHNEFIEKYGNQLQKRKKTKTFSVGDI